MTHEERAQIRSKAMEALKRHDVAESNRLMKLIPLSLAMAKMLAYNHGKQWLIDEGWDLSEVETEYGPEWLAQ